MSETAAVADPVTCPECGLSHPDIFINKKKWTTLEPAEFEAFRQAVFTHYRATGYPQYVLTDAEKQKELAKLINFDHSTLIKGDSITQSMHALGLAWSYHPHHIGVECNGLRTVENTWNDDALLHKVIDKRLKYGSYISDSGIRKSVRSYTGTQAVSNFRPSAAAAIYHKYLPENGVTWDMSMGWGGRLLGAVACHKVAKYIGCDPATETFAGLQRMDADIKRLLPERGLETSLHMLGSETAEMRAPCRKAASICVLPARRTSTARSTPTKTRRATSSSQPLAHGSLTSWVRRWTIVLMLSSRAVCWR